jgi:hypothetical protein
MANQAEQLTLRPLNIAALKARQKAAAKSGSSGSKTGRKSLAGTESEGGSE